MNEIPLEVDLLNRIDLRDYKQTLTSRRYQKVGDSFVMVDKTQPEYECAPFGELILSYSPNGKHRIQRITIMFSRIMKL